MRARGRAALLLALVDGGLRAHEVIALTVADISLKEGMLLVRRAKGRRPRLIALGGETMRALRRYATLRDDPALVLKAKASWHIPALLRSAATRYQSQESGARYQITATPQPQGYAKPYPKSVTIYVWDVLICRRAIVLRP